MRLEETKASSIFTNESVGKKAGYLKEFITPDQSQHQGVSRSGGGRSMAPPFGIIGRIHAVRITDTPS